MIYIPPSLFLGRPFSLSLSFFPPHYPFWLLALDPLTFFPWRKCQTDGGKKKYRRKYKKQQQQQPEKMAEHFVEQRNKKIDEWRKYYGKNRHPLVWGVQFSSLENNDGDECWCLFWVGHRGDDNDDSRQRFYREV